MLIAMAGLPGTGKSMLAARLAEALGGVVLSKDVVRAGLFPAGVIDYSREQDDFAMKVVYNAAERMLRDTPNRTVILDGRTYSKAYQIGDVVELAMVLRQPLRVIECVCDDEIAEARLAKDATAGTHPAGNRTPDLYRRAKAAAVPLTVPRLTLDTGRDSIDENLLRAVAHLTGGG
jgi:predicted kinase